MEDDRGVKRFKGSELAKAQNVKETVWSNVGSDYKARLAEIKGSAFKNAQSLPRPVLGSSSSRAVCSGPWSTLGSSTLRFSEPKPALKSKILQDLMHPEGVLGREHGPPKHQSATA